MPTRPLARTALYAHITGDINDVVNGVLVKTSIKDLPAMRARAVGYDRVRIACLEWYHVEAPPFLGYILHCPDEPRSGRRFTKDRLEPHRGYYLVCRQGAAERGTPRFQAMSD